MSKQLRELQARKSTLVKDARALTDIAAAEQREMNEEEVSAFEALKSKIEATSAAIDREAALIAEEAHMMHTAHLPNASVITVVDNASSAISAASRSMAAEVASILDFRASKALTSSSFISRCLAAAMSVRARASLTKVDLRA